VTSLGRRIASFGPVSFGFAEMRALLRCQIVILSAVAYSVLSNLHPALNANPLAVGLHAGFLTLLVNSLVSHLILSPKLDWLTFYQVLNVAANINHFL
jgi:hypothetical protein